MACKTDSGLEFDCSNLLSVGGVQPTIWYGYLSELDTSFSLTLTGDISQIDFGPYGGLRRLEGNKFWHSAGYEQVEAAGGNKSYTHTVNVKVIADSTEDDATLHTMSLGNDLFFLVPDNNRVIKIYMPGAGAKSTVNLQNTGQAGDSDTTNQLTFVGSELVPPLRFMRAAGYDNSIAYLESFEL